MIADGYLRLCIPESVGGDGRSLVDTVLVYEELYTENASVALTLLGTMLGLQPLLVGGSADQQKQMLAPFLETSGVYNHFGQVTSGMDVLDKIQQGDTMSSIDITAS